MSSHYAIDYFATLGREPGPLKCKTFPFQIHEDDPSLSGPELWQEAITDIILVSADDQLPDSECWSFVNETLGGAPLDYPWIAFRKRKDSKRTEHVTQVKFISSGEPVPVGFELIRTTASGKHSGYIKPHGFLALKRSLADAYSYFNGEPMIYDICVLKKSLKEEIPERYIPIEKDSQGAWSSLSSDLTFASRNLPAMGLCNLSYEAVTLDRYPRKDISSQIQLPEQALPVFAFPRNLRLEMALNSEYPLPVFYTFVFTDQEGNNMFAACLKFFETVPLSALEPVAQEIYGSTDILNLPPDAGIFCPKVICVLSHKPFYRAMGRYLKHIYSLSLSSSICPLEHFITSVVAKIPLPCEGGRPFHVVLDAALIAPTSRPMKPIVFKMPNHRSFPLMDLDFAGPLRCLSVDIMLAVFVLMLREAKIVFLSSSNTMLTETMETLRCLLFPLTWSSCFVSRLPKTLSGLLQAPGGFMVGIHLEPTELSEMNNAPSMKSNKNNQQQHLQEMMRKYIQFMHFDYPMLAGTYIIDLNSNMVYQFNGHFSEGLPSNQIDTILKTLPSGPKLRLRSKLLKIAEEYQIAPQVIGTEALDSAFDFQHQQSETEKLHWEMFPTLEIRDSFMSFMIDLLGEYPRYMKPPNTELIDDTFRTFQEEFKIPDYIKDCGDIACKPLLEYLMETQMFSVLIQSRSEATAEPLVFFEQAAQLQRELGLSAGGHASGKALTNASSSTTTTSSSTIQSNNHQHHGIAELPEPLYVLLEAEHRWSNLTKVMQQQILQQSSLYNFEDKTLKQYSLTYLNHSSLASITGGQNVTESYHPVNNQKLLDLLIFTDFSNGLTDIDEEATTSALTTTSYAVLRTELDRGEDLHLDEGLRGALILPGPIIPVSYDEKKATSQLPYFASLAQYSYKNGWPQLDIELLEKHLEITHPKITDLIQERAFHVNKLNPVLRLLIRSPSERLAAENVTKLRHVHQHQIAAVTNDPNALKIHKDLTTAISALVDIASLSITMLTLRIMNQVKPISDILQILGILAQLESVHLQYYLHENMWRSVLVGCAAIGGDIMRRISVVIRDTLHALQFHLDALTYGQFIKANQAAKVQIWTATKTGDLFDQFLYLEELGYVWYQQKSIHLPINPTINTTDKGGTKAKVVKSPLQEALDLVIKQLILQKSEGLMPFHRPRQIAATSLPIMTKDLSDQSIIPLLQSEMQARLDKTYLVVKQWAQQQKQQEQQLLQQQHGNSASRRTTSEEKKIRPSSSFSINASTLSPISAMSKFGKGIFGGGGKSSAKSSPVPTIPEEGTSNPAATSRTSITPPPSSKSFSSFARFLGGGLGGQKGRNDSKETEKTTLTQPESGVSSETDQVNLAVALDEVAASLPVKEVDQNQPSLFQEVVTNGDNNNSSFVTPIKQPKVDSSTEGIAPTELSIITDPEVILPEGEEASRSSEDSTSSTSQAPPVNPLSLNELQDRLLESFTTEFTQQRKAIAIHNYHPCNECGYVMMDEELMNCWFRASSIDVHSPTHRVRSCMDLNQDKGVICPECERSIQPKLFITCYQLPASPTTPEGASKDHTNAMTGANDVVVNLNQLEALWQQEVLFINPFLLRYEMEELLIKFGERINWIDWLFTYYPAMVWNCLWYSHRCYLPSGFIFKTQMDTLLQPGMNNSLTTSPNIKKIKEDYYPKLYSRKEYELLRNSTFSLQNGEEGKFHLKDLGLPIMIGWKESVVKSKILRMLEGKSGNYLDLRDLYPNLPMNEFEIITSSVLSNLDGSPFGMRLAIINFRQCESLFEPIISEYQRSKKERQQRKEEIQTKIPMMRKTQTTAEKVDGDGDKKEEVAEREGEGEVSETRQSLVGGEDSDEEDETNDSSSEDNEVRHRGGTKRSFGSTTVSYRSATRRRDLEIARLIYMNLLILSIHFARFQLFLPTPTGFNRDLEREAEFDRIYIDCVKCVLSKPDLEQIQTTEECLSECTKVHQRTNIVRGVFGLLP